LKSKTTGGMPATYDSMHQWTSLMKLGFLNGDRGPSC
jgi:hypothetical protein